MDNTFTKLSAWKTGNHNKIPVLNSSECEYVLFFFSKCDALPDITIEIFRPYLIKGLSDNFCC